MNCSAELIVEKYSDMIYRIALAQLGSESDAQDVVSDVLLKYMTFSGKADIGSKEHLKAWLIRVTLNRCKDIFRAAKAIPTDIFPEETADIPPIDVRLDIRAAMEDIPPKYRSALYLYYYEGYKTREIAQMLGIPKSTVTNDLARARKMLKHKLKGYDR